ncbi:hypothetical protein GLAREA_09880 [Glarea lozoyensis ATCC 20868]|uniref:Xylanolytic transcriptional activator regulatory domain-containing protein n=1 Tax=Glarea lozoyensis (strain ATCC 20868 / MF5171) TaxID=1116229 RepID=S3CUV7_GLAL2|nr:uncharacterized protein GLAREA_09880 [Glarea lozoyensis ATCC 20868]EPE28759.1 hypothetical protein GLAREA_09880 [Glarea lozoyensis ATCC 20868]
MSSTSSPPEGSKAVARTGSDGNTAEAPGKGGTKASRQRFKPQLSCTLLGCKFGKAPLCGKLAIHPVQKAMFTQLKCDRNSPCQNCIKRDLAATCTYVHAGLRGSKQSSVHKSTNLSQRDVQSQISRLEELVVSLMNKSRAAGSTNKPGAPQTQSSDDTSSPNFELTTTDDQWTEITGVKNATESLGMINIKDNQPSYVESSHWTAILDNIACLKDCLDPKDEPAEKQQFPPKPPGPDLLVGSIRGATRTEILASLPSRNRVDRLVEAYFSELDMGAIILHKPTFEKEYESFWANPADTPIMWIGMLYAIICQATQFETMTGLKPTFDTQDIAIQDLEQLVDMFREKTVQCLVLGNYTEPGPYTIETLCFYYISEHFRSPDTMFGLWMVWGIIIRAALRLGLHRDGSNYPAVSAFQAEMNRRRWSALVHLDIMTSCQVGLPRMLKEEMYDTTKASNLEDVDFDQNVKVLPPPRPASELTPIGFHNIKGLFSSVFGRIVDQASSTKAVSYDEIMKLDKMLHEAHQKTPEEMRVIGPEDLQTGTITSRNRKFTCALTYQKACCFLHRRFFILSKSTSTYPYPYSMKSCVDAASDMIKVQIYMHGQQKPGMPLYTSRWKTSSLMTQDYLLADMLLCLYLGHCVSVPGLEEKNAKMGIRVKSSREEMLRILDGSLEIWEEASPHSTEAAKAATALKQMLKKVRAVNTSKPVEPSRISHVQAVSGPTITPQTHASHTNAYPWIQQIPSKPITFDWQSPPSFDNTPTPSSGSDSVATNNLYPGQMLNDQGPLMDLDWDIWDAQFQDQAGLSEWNFSTAPILPLPQDNNMNFGQW